MDLKDKVLENTEGVRLTDFVNATKGQDPVMPQETMRLGDYMSLQSQAVMEAPEIMQVTPEQRAAWKAKGPIGFFEAATEWVDKTEMIPFNPEAFVKIGQLKMSVDRIRTDKYQDEDLLRVNNFLSKYEEQRDRGYSFGGNVARGAAFLPGFMIEFLATGGLYTAGKTATVKGATKLLEKGGASMAKKATVNFAVRSIGAATGTVYRTAAMPHRIGQAYYANEIYSDLTLTPKGIKFTQESQQSPFISMAKAFGDVYIENLSEITGPTIGKVGGKVLSKVVPKKFMNAMMYAYQKLHPNKKVTDLFSKAGWNGFLEEMGEERVGDIMRAVTGVSDFGAKNPESMMDRMVSSIPGADEMLVEAAVLAIPGAANFGVGEAVNRLRQIKKKSGVLEAESKLESMINPEVDYQAIDQILATEESDLKTALLAMPVGDVYTVEDGRIVTSPEMVEKADALRQYTVPQQRILDGIVYDTIAENNVKRIEDVEEHAPTEVDDRAKSSNSLALKVARKLDAAQFSKQPANYTLADISDHTRNAILINNWKDLPGVFKSLASRGNFRLESMLVSPHPSGYRGIFLKIQFKNGLNGEIQIHTPAGWKLKTQTDIDYRDFRVISMKKLHEDPKLLAEFQRLQKTTQKKYNDFYKKAYKGSLSELDDFIKRSASSAGITLESNMAPTAMSGITQAPRDGDQALQASVSNKIPSAESANLNESAIGLPPSTISISQEEAAVKGKALDETARQIQTLKAQLKGIIPDEQLDKMDKIINKVMEQMRAPGEQTPPPVSHGEGGITPPEFQFGNWKDIPVFLQTRDILERNIEKIAGNEAGKVKAFITEPIKVNETNRAAWLNLMRDRIEKRMKDLGIRYKSKESKLTMRYGENRMTLDELKNALPKTWNNVVQAADFFREQYDMLLDTINDVRHRFGYNPIPKRADYFRHYQEIGNVINSFGLILRENDLPTGISGITALFRPGKPFTTVELQRMGGKFTEDAIGAMDNYLDQVSKQIFHTDSVQRARLLDKYIRTQSETNNEIQLANFVSNLSEYANLLAGKKADIDRGFERYLGRPIYSVINYLKRRTGANMIGANISSALMNIIPFTQSLATTKKAAAIRGIFEGTFAGLRGNQYEIDGVKSELFTRRYPRNTLAMSFFGKTEEGLNTLFRMVDQFSVKSIIAGKYYEGRDSGMTPEQAMKEADNYTARLVADRSWGQLPNLMSSKTLGLFTQFQTEVNNMFSFLLHDIPQSAKGDWLKVANQLIQYSILSFLFNDLYEKIMGRRPTIDPIYAVATMAGWSELGKEKDIGDRSWETFKDVTGNLPFGNVFIEGGRFPIAAGIPSLKTLMTAESDEVKYRELLKPLYYFGFPIAGGQVKKSIEGLNDYAKGKAVTAGTHKKKYEIEQDFANFMRGFLFGRWSFPEAQEYRMRPKKSAPGKRKKLI